MENNIAKSINKSCWKNNGVEKATQVWPRLVVYQFVLEMLPLDRLAALARKTKENDVKNARVKRIRLDYTLLK